MASLAKSQDRAGFRKEAMYSSRKMAHRVAASIEVAAYSDAEVAAPSYLRRKRAQGRTQFQKPADDSNK
jgi:hypothetical protein